MTVRDIESALEELAPASLKLGNDPIGRCIGSHETEVHRLGVALDASDAVITKCVDLGINVLITHHPLIYAPVSRLDKVTGFPESAVIAAIKAGLTVISAHTNWDCATGGINDVLAKLLDLNHCLPIERSAYDSECITGLGRIGRLDVPLEETKFKNLVESRLNISVRCSERRDRMVQTIAVCGGAGESLFSKVRGVADIFITSDVRHHMFVASYGQPCTIWDAGHRETEVPGTKELGIRLAEKIGKPVTWVGDCEH
jgi:dinuclear metal center YbgI/SA1388 family protein